jgi:ribonuclease HI
LGKQTNNHAEYMGLILGLEAARERGATEVDVFADSQLLIRQLEGKYQVKSATLRPLFEEARGLLGGFARVTLTHIPREENSAADEMSNRAIDERL